MEVQVFLLGNPRVLLDHTEVIFPYRKVEGLFYYLCIKGVVSRDEAIGIFWADCTEGSARKNLRDALYHLKALRRGAHQRRGQQPHHLKEGVHRLHRL